MKHKKFFQTLFVSFTTLSLIIPQTTHAEAKVGDVFGDWIYECRALAENKTACSLSQTIMSKNQNKRLVKFTLGRNEKTKAVNLTALLPLGIHLPSGVNFSIDQGKTYQFTLKTCFQLGCVATYPVDTSFMQALQNGQKLHINFTGEGADAPIKISGSLKGLAEGVKATNLN